LRCQQTVTNDKDEPLTGKALEHDQKEVCQSEKHSARHQQTYRPNMPSVDGGAKVEMTNGEFEKATDEDIQQFAQIPELQVDQ
jgi:hypothetical protein